MVKMLKLMVAIVNKLHDLIESFSSGFNTQLDDKQLHFIVIAIIGMLIYFIVNMAFKAMAKYSISILSFIYTFTVLLVIVFAIELEQKLTNRGQMEFADIVAGVWGFIAVFAVYIIIYNLISFIKKSIKKMHTGKNIKR